MVLGDPLGHDVARAPQQQFEQLGLAHRQRDRRVRDPHQPRLEIEAQAPARQRPADIAPLATQYREQAGVEFVDVERLHQIIVGAFVEPADARVDRAAGGEDQHRAGVAAPAQPVQQRKPVLVRQPQIEQDRGIVAVLEIGVRFVAAAREIDREAARGQRCGQRLGEIAVVLDQQYPHRSSPRLGAVQHP